MVLGLTKLLSSPISLSLTLLTFCISSWERRYCNWRVWLGPLQRGECCGAALTSESFSGLSETSQKPVGIIRSEPPELPPSPPNTAKRRWITTILERSYTFSALNGAVVHRSSASAGCLHRWAWGLREDFSLCFHEICLSGGQTQVQGGLNVRRSDTYYPTWCYISWPVPVMASSGTDPFCHANKQSSQKKCWQVAEKQRLMT